MSSILKASPTLTRTMGSDVDVTSTVIAGSTKNALDVNNGGLNCVDKARLDLATPVTTAAYTTLIASTALAATSLSIFNSSTKVLVLAFGAAASEADKIYVPPGSDATSFPLAVPAGTRLSVKAVDANTSAGNLLINLFG